MSPVGLFIVNSCTSAMFAKDQANPMSLKSRICFQCEEALQWSTRSPDPVFDDLGLGF